MSHLRMGKGYKRVWVLPKNIPEEILCIGKKFYLNILSGSGVNKNLHLEGG